MCGDMEGVSVTWCIENYDIVVMTAQILVNALNSGEVASLEVLTLILLDECHNTTGKHPYNNIMTRYLDTKLTSGTHSLPQVPHHTVLVCSTLFCFTLFSSFPHHSVSGSLQFIFVGF